MNKFEFFCLVKNVLTEAQKAGWKHQPEHDRYICDEVTLCFSKFEDEDEVLAMDLTFDLCAFDVVKSGIAKITNGDFCYVLNGEDIVFVDIAKFFDPMCITRYSKLEQPV